MKNEPVMTLVTLTIASVAGVLVAFGVHLTDAQVQSLQGLAEALVLAGLYVRSRVTPVAKVAAARADIDPTP